MRDEHGRIEKVVRLLRDATNHTGNLGNAIDRQREQHRRIDRHDVLDGVRQHAKRRTGRAHDNDVREIVQRATGTPDDTPEVEHGEHVAAPARHANDGRARTRGAEPIHSNEKPRTRTEDSIANRSPGHRERHDVDAELRAPLRRPTIASQTRRARSSRIVAGSRDGDDHAIRLARIVESLHARHFEQKRPAGVVTVPVARTVSRRRQRDK